LLLPEFERSILELLVEGFERWKAGGFQRAGDHENDFTAVLIGHMLQVRRERDLPFLPQPEQVEFSADVLAGRARPNRAPRIDIAVWWDRLAEGAYFTIECKRLAPGDLIAEYVEEGMIRFVSQRYASAVRAAAMAGYVIHGDPEQLWQQVNLRVTRTVSLGSAHLLGPRSPIANLATVYESRHPRSGSTPVIVLTHLFLDARSRPPLPVKQTGASVQQARPPRPRRRK